jgi:hypothetical protein
METITRVGFCADCAKNDRPKTDQPFFAFNVNKNEFEERYALHNGVPGYTPHIYRAKLVGANVIVLINCAMYECGTTNYKQVADRFTVSLTHVVREVWTIKQWEDLKKYSRDFDYDI